MRGIDHTSADHTCTACAFASGELVFTNFGFQCRSCMEIRRATKQIIADMRASHDHEGQTDFQVAASVDVCLACANVDHIAPEDEALMAGEIVKASEYAAIYSERPDSQRFYLICKIGHRAADRVTFEGVPDNTRTRFDSARGLSRIGGLAGGCPVTATGRCIDSTHAHTLAVARAIVAASRAPEPMQLSPIGNRIESCMGDLELTDERMRYVGPVDPPQTCGKPALFVTDHNGEPFFLCDECAEGGVLAPTAS